MYSGREIRVVLVVSFLGQAVCSCLVVVGTGCSGGGGIQVSTRPSEDDTCLVIKEIQPGPVSEFNSEHSGKAIQHEDCIAKRREQRQHNNQHRHQ